MACMHAWLPICTLGCIHACLHTCHNSKLAYVAAYTYACIPAYMYVCLHICAPACMYERLPAYMHACMHGIRASLLCMNCLHICMSACLPACMHGCLHIYIGFPASMTYMWYTLIQYEQLLDHDFIHRLMHDLADTFMDTSFSYIYIYI